MSLELNNKKLKAYNLVKSIDFDKAFESLKNQVITKEMFPKFNGVLDYDIVISKKEEVMNSVSFALKGENNRELVNEFIADFIIRNHLSIDKIKKHGFFLNLELFGRLWGYATSLLILHKGLNWIEHQVYDWIGIAKFKAESFEKRLEGYLKKYSYGNKLMFINDEIEEIRNDLKESFTPEESKIWKSYKTIRLNYLDKLENLKEILINIVDEREIFANVLLQNLECTYINLTSFGTGVFLTTQEIQNKILTLSNKLLLNIATKELLQFCKENNLYGKYIKGYDTNGDDDDDEVGNLLKLILEIGDDNMRCNPYIKGVDVAGLFENIIYYSYLTTDKPEKLSKVSYQWVGSDIEKELSELYALMLKQYKLIAEITTQEEFKAVFKGSSIESIKPIKWHDSNVSEIIYFISRLEETENIKFSGRSDYKKMVNCFVTSEGQKLNANFKELKQKMIINLAIDKQEAIDKLISNF